MTSSNAEPPWPGLNDDPLPGLNAPLWMSMTSTGISKIDRARQWTRIPLQAAIAKSGIDQLNYPPDDPEGRRQYQGGYANLTWSSPANGARGYGESLPFTVRTVAFGAVPVEARVQLTQLRDEDDVPVPFKSHGAITTFWTGQWGRVEAAEASGSVRVRVLELSVDGVDLGLRASCQSRAPATLTLSSKEGFVDRQPSGADPLEEHKAWSDDLSERGLFANLAGGRLDGTVEIPPFSNCRSATGEDISPLLTASVSGPANSVSITTPNTTAGEPCWTPVGSLGIRKQRGPFQGDPTVNCREDPNTLPWDPPFPERP